MNNKFVRIVALVLAALILLGVVAGAIINTFAINPTIETPLFEGLPMIVPITIGIIGLSITTVALLISKIKNNSK